MQDEEGAANFITGAGGFLQAIFNGYAGIRVYLDRMEIRRTQMPENCEFFTVRGLSYLNSKFDIEIAENDSFISFTRLLNDLYIKIGDGKIRRIIKRRKCK